jgi:hypothetical protein
MAEHCSMMPEMQGCEKYTALSNSKKMSCGADTS